MDMYSSVAQTTASQGQALFASWLWSGLIWLDDLNLFLSFIKVTGMRQWICAAVWFKQLPHRAKLCWVLIWSGLIWLDDLNLFSSIKVIGMRQWICAAVWLKLKCLTGPSFVASWFDLAWRFVFGLARRGSAIGFHLLRHTAELPWILVFGYHSNSFDFYFFALMYWLSWEPLCEPNFFLCISALRVASGPMVKLAGRKSALNPCGLFYWLC